MPESPSPASTRRKLRTWVYRADRPDHDGGHHLLFGHPRMVEDLLAGFITEPWVAALDLDGLQRVNAKLHGTNYLFADGDMIWRVPLRSGGVAYLYIALEFQSKPDRWMAVRMAAAVILLYLHLIRENARRKKRRRDPLIESGRLPPVFPLVLYNGAPEWHAETEIANLVAELPGLGPWPWRPHFRYHVLAERHLTLPSGEKADNLVAILFEIEQCRTVEAVAEQAERLAVVLAGEEYATLRQAFLTYITGVFALARKLPIGRGQVANLVEFKSMLSELGAKVRREREEAVKAAAAKAAADTAARVTREVLAEKVTRLLEKRFGPLPDERRKSVQEAETDLLEVWFDRAIDASGMDAVFGRSGLN